MSEPINLSKKIILLGDPAVGKTSMIRKFVYDLFEDKYISTLGTKVSSKQLTLNHPNQKDIIKMKIMVWDVMGQKEYEMFHQSAYMGSQGAILVCDTTRRETLDNLPNWISSLFDVTGEIPMIITANKCDLIGQFQFQQDDLTRIASTFDVPYFFTSAKTGEKVENVFTLLGERIIKTDYHS